MNPRNLFLSLPLALLMGCTMQQTPAFDSQAWQSQRGADPQQNRRGTMVEAVEGVVRAGMTRAEVVALLGEPDSADPGTDIYELGVSPVGIDEEYYEVGYEDGRVSSHGWRRR